MKETMTARERWLAVLRREQPDRVPMDFWSTTEVNEKVMKHLGVSTLDEVFARLHVDKVFGVSPRYIGPEIPADRDMWGCRYEDIAYGTGVYRECVYHPLAQYDSVEEIEREYTWPNPDWWDYSDIAEQIKGKEDRPIAGGHSEPFLQYKSLRGMEQAYMDLALNPEIVHYCLDHMFGLDYQDAERIYEQIPGQVNITYVAEDLGSQNGLLMSKKHISEFLFPRMKRMMDITHQAGAYVFYHTDGGAREIIPELIELGIDILNPIQWRCAGMEREGLKRDFGDQVVFHGAVDNQYTLPFGSVEEVRQEVKDNLRILGAGGGYILAPCHNLQAVSPVENIIALYETGYAEGWT